MSNGPDCPKCGKVGRETCLGCGRYKDIDPPEGCNDCPCGSGWVCCNPDCKGEKS